MRARQYGCVLTRYIRRRGNDGKTLSEGHTNMVAFSRKEEVKIIRKKKFELGVK